MNEKECYKLSVMSKIVLTAVTILFLVGANVLAQSPSDKKTIPIPSEEKFQPDDDLIADATGLGKRTFYNQSDQDVIRIYNQDGSVWYEFSFYESSPLYFKNNPKSEFKPFAALNYSKSFLKLRIKAVSENWYEVTVNEETQESKYISKSDPVLGRWSFEEFIRISVTVTFDKENNLLRETPDGKIKNIEILDSDKFFVRRVKGDWLQVSVNNGNELGWIRWRKDRAILIGYISNNWEFKSKEK